MQNLRMFEVKYLGATDKRGARVRITDTRNKKSVLLKKHYDFDLAIDQAIHYLTSLGIKLEHRAWNEINGKDYLLTNDFSTQLKKEV